MLTIADDRPPLICDLEDVTFYLGTHHPPWLADEPNGAPDNVCLFVSHRRLRELKRLPVAPLGRGYAIDSGAALDLPLHGFGVKLEGLARYGRWLSSADSMAWSYHYRRLPPVDGCMGKRGLGVKNCANCLHAALSWREHVLEVIAGAKDAAEQLEIDLWSDAA